jgi:hypothetical protein
LKSEFQKISRVPSMAGGTKWYLSDDCLLAAKRILYTVEYRRFYLRDLESIVVWPNRLWLLRVIIPAVIFLGIGVWVWALSSVTIAAIFGVVGLGWIAAELALGPTASARIRATGATIELPIVRRTRRARKVLARIDEAVRATRIAATQPATSVAAPLSEQNASRASENAVSTSSLIADATQTGGS